MGLSISGTGLGTIVYPWLSRSLILHYGWRGALLVCAAINAHVCCAALLMRPNQEVIKVVTVLEPTTDSALKNKNDMNVIKSTAKLEVSNEKRELIIPTDNISTSRQQELHLKAESLPHERAFTSKTHMGLQHQISRPFFLKFKYIRQDLGLDIFSNVTFILLCINTFLFCFAISVMYTHIAAYAASLHMNQSSRDLLLSCIGFTNLIGRVALGSAAQFLPVHATWLFIISYFLAGVGVLFCALWMTFPGLMISVCTFGFFSAGFGPLLAEVTCLTVGVMKFTLAYGYLMVFMAVGTIIGAPVAGKSVVLSFIIQLLPLMC